MSMAEKLFRMGFGGFSRMVPSGASNVARKLMMTPRKSEPRDWEQGMPEPDQEIALDHGAYLSIWHGGPMGVLFIHGWEGRITQFTPLMKKLDRSLFTFYALHPPGHGLSQEGESHPGRFIESIRGAMAVIGAPIHAAVGHSMGAGVLGYIQAHDQPFRRLVLVAGPAHFEGVLRRFSTFLGLGTLAEKRFLAAVESRVGLPAEKLDLRAFGNRITQPVLVVHDHDDKEIPFSDGLQLSRALPSAHLLDTKGLGHRRILRDEKVIESVNEFLCGFLRSQ